MEVSSSYQRGNIVSRKFSSRWQLDIEIFLGQEYFNDVAYAIINATYIFFLAEIMQNGT